MPTKTSSRSVRLWLWSVAALIFITVIVGGATRLTESGLSIVEWRPVTGMVPPLSQAEWAAEFEKYKVIPQYEIINKGMSLDDFKTIFWWEWVHRLLGRLIGFVFLLPFLWFLWRGAIEPGMRAGLATIFTLGAIQGAVGWWMVSSGLTEGVRVAHGRLAFHLTLACVIYAAVVWTAARIGPAGTVAPGAQQGEPPPLRLRLTAFALIALTLVQFYLGALVAGLRAGLIYNTWPLIDGALIPNGADLFFASPWWINLFENTLTVQFIHRMAGYALVLLVLLHLIDITRTRTSGQGTFNWAAVLLLAMVGQVALGVYTLILHVPIEIALLHQGGALVVLTIAVLHAARLTPRRVARTASAEAEPALGAGKA
ncbi:MAG: COX15/CtaA family protein [Xanthobacteraceae bacterium]